MEQFTHMVLSLRRLTAVMHVCVAMDLLSVRTPPPARVNVRRISHIALIYTEQENKHNNYIPLNFVQTMILVYNQK